VPQTVAKVQAARTTRNEDVAQALEEVGELLASQRANPFRATAYRRAAETVRRLDRPLAGILAAGGVAALTELPGVGESLARVIVEIVESGRLGLLERLRGEAGADALLATVPGVGAELAKRIHEQLGVETLEELEMAAHEGRLETVRGFGARRLRGVIEALAGRLGRRARAPVSTRIEPSVSELLDVDREYRERAAAGTLHRITPRRFNPRNESWLPILHTERGNRQYTALFSNSFRAHELGKTTDWVVIYADDGRSERQATVVTETRGPLRGRRVVRGRERECAELVGRDPQAVTSGVASGVDPRGSES
jgi:DNA polymerase (family 10)